MRLRPGPLPSVVAALGALGALALAAPAPAAAQAAPPSGDAWLLRDDVQFAEDLARYRFFDLAFEEVDRLKGRTLDTQAAGTLAFHEARILKRASESTADGGRQLDFLTRAIDLLADWARPGTAYVYHERRPEALEDLASLLQARGLLRAQQMKAAGSPDARSEAQLAADKDYQQAEDVLTALQREYGALAEAAEAAGRADAAARLKEKASLTLYNRGLNNLQWADVAKDAEFRLESARDALVDYQWELEEEKLSQYFALHYQGVVLRKLGQSADALEVQRDVIEKAQYWWDNSLATADPVSAAYIAELFDRTWGETANLQADTGDVDAGDATITAMMEKHTKAKLALGRPGWQVLLAWAERLQGLGRQGRASEILKQVADGAATLSEGERARDLLASIATSGSGALQGSASVLMAAAKGLFDRKDFAEAAFMYEQAGAGLLTPEDRKSFGVAAWLGAGRALGSVQRHLEAGLAFERALDAAAAAGLDADTQNALAMEMYNAYDRRAKETGDAFDRGLKARVLERVTKLGVGSDLSFYEAKERFDEAAAKEPPDPALYEQALAAFRAVPDSAGSHERALVYAARCAQGAGRVDEALAGYDAMLKRAADPALVPQDAPSRTRREVALGEALYYKADLLLSDAVARPADALKLLEGLEGRLPSQAGFIESGKYQRALAWTQLGELDKAAAAIEDLKAFRADSSYLRAAWFKLSNALVAASDAAAAKKDDKAAQALLLRAADALWSSAELSGFPSFANVLSAGDWYARAGDPVKAARSYGKALEVFDKPGTAVTVAQLDQARLGSAQALTAQRDFAHAQPIWKDLVTRTPNNPVIMRGAARSFGGWLERGPGGELVEVEGSGDYEDAIRIWGEIAARLPASSRYAPEWWESRLGLVYAEYRQGLIHASDMEAARQRLGGITAVFPDYDGDAPSSGDPSGPPYKPLFQYLEKKIPKP